MNPGNISTYSWDFGDGTQFTTANDTTSHTYASGGNYNVLLITTDVHGFKDTILKNNYIHSNGPVANFSATNTGGCSGLTTTFTDLSIPDGTNPIVSWQWNFGDGTIQTFTAPPFTHAYTTPGVFSVSLKITDASGCVDTITMNNLIHSTDPWITFFANNTVTCPGAPLTWGVSGVNYDSLLWNFGDGTTSTLTFPPKSYSASGIYTVKLYATDAYGCTDSLVRNNYITVGSPNASFVADDTVSVCSPFEVNFTNTSTFYNAQTWTFEPGVTSTLPNPSYYFTAPGTFNVELITTSPGGCLDTAYKTIILYDTAGFRVDYNPFNGCNPLNINFNAVSTGTPTYIWDFGDGQTLVSNSPSISHTYASFGNFLPKVILQDETGCLVPLNGADTVRIIGAVANFGLDKNFFCQTGTVNFTDSTTFNDPVVSYNWNFGDGNTSTSQNPSHIYSSPGLFNVSLVVQTQFGCTDTMRIDSAIKIVANPQVRIDGNNSSCAGDPILFTGNFIIPDTSMVTWSWTFGNGSTSNMQNPPAQTYNQSGSYIVTAIAINSSGCKDTTIKNLTVHALPTVTMPATITIPAGTTISIPATYSGNMTSYVWTPSTFLNCTSCPRPDATPPYTIQYTVTFTDSNSCDNKGSIIIKAECKNANVFIPNLFSPYVDGSNDVFYPRVTGLDRAKHMRIFNRWGEIVFEKYDMPVNSAAAGWDGTWKGKKANADTYVYQIEIYCQNGELLTYTGNITLIR
jgi:gliding motility-associated-like protein